MFLSNLFSASLEKDDMGRILVTGGAGFIGSHLCGRLLREGHEVVCMDNFSTGARANLRDLMAHRGLHILEHDVTAPLEVAADEIYNLACPASPDKYQQDPIGTTRTCVLGALQVLELARRLQVRVLQASTSEIYGDPEMHPQSESYWGHVNAVGPRSCYDEGKRCAETLFYDFHRQHGVRIKIARIFNTYGPRMRPDDGRVVSNFIVQALRGQPITIFGDGNQTRSFCYVDDLIDGLLRLMAAPDDFTGPLNLGNPVEITIRELAEKIIELTGSRSALVFKPLPCDDPRRRKPDIRLAEATLGWRPKTPLDEGLAQTIQYFESGCCPRPRRRAARSRDSAQRLSRAGRGASGLGETRSS